MRLDALVAVEQVEFMPEDLKEGILYVSQPYSVAIHLCACGCGVKTVTPLKTIAGVENWTLVYNLDGTVTLDPSIGNQQFPCKSHYRITNSLIEWYPD